MGLELESFPIGPDPLSSFPATPVQAPEPSSINGIIREHSRERLYVTPLQWSEKHLQLLDCQFARKAISRKRDSLEQPSSHVKQTRDPESREQPGRHHRKPTAALSTEQAIRLAYRLSLRWRDARTSAVRDLLGSCGMSLVG